MMIEALIEGHLPMTYSAPSNQHDVILFINNIYWKSHTQYVFCFSRSQEHVGATVITRKLTFFLQKNPSQSKGIIEIRHINNH